MTATDISAVAGKVDSRIFRRALGNFATGVTIVTASANGQRVGVTANSFNSVSLDPPLILWSIDKRSGSFTVFSEATHFAVNILSAAQIDLSNQFARPGDDRFSGTNVREGIGGCLLLPDTSAAFECERYQIVDGGDHWIIIGKVVDFQDHGRSPLLYHQGTYSMVLPHPQLGIREEVLPPSGEFHSRLVNNYFYLMTQAVRNYQQVYQAEQQKSGWSAGEARILLVLDSDDAVDMPMLVHQAAMPVREVEPILALLSSRGLVEKTDGGYVLTSAGQVQAAEVWSIAMQQQDRVFSGFSAQELTYLKDMLKRIITGCC